MKKTTLRLLGAGFALGTLFVVSCKKDKLTKQEQVLDLESSLAQQQARTNDSLLHVGGVIRYSVLVYSANNSAGKKEHTSGLQGASVAMEQNGQIITLTTDANGQVVFPNARIGNVVVTVSMAGYTTLNYHTSLDPGAINFPTTTNGTTDLSNIVRDVSTHAPIFALTGAANMATIKGNATIDLDLTNVSREVVPAGTVVSAEINVTNTFKNLYFNDQTTTTNNSAGIIMQGSYESAISTATTDASGNYTLNVPASVDGLPIIVYFQDVIATQTLVFRGYAEENLQPTTWASVRTVRTSFSQNFSNSNTYSSIPAYRPVTAKVSAPPAQGSGAAVNLVFAAQSAIGATGSLNVIQTGTLTPGAYSVTVNGGGYNSHFTTPQPSVPASLTILVDNFGNASLSVGTYGYGYTSQPSFVVNYAGPNAVTLTFSPYNLWSSSVAGFGTGSTTFNNGNYGSTITSGGSGYVVAPTVRWIPQGNNVGTTNTAFTINGVVVDITIPGFGNLTSLPNVVFEPQQSLNAILGAVTVNNDGSIPNNAATVLFGGAGYSTIPGSTPPTITFVSLIPGFSPTSPIVDAQINGNGVFTGYTESWGGSGWPTQTNANTPTSFVGFTIGGNASGASLSFSVLPGNVYERDVYYGTGYHERGVQ